MGGNGFSFGVFLLFSLIQDTEYRSSFPLVDGEDLVMTIYSSVLYFKRKWTNFTFHVPLFLSPSLKILSVLPTWLLNPFLTDEVCLISFLIVNFGKSSVPVTLGYPCLANMPTFLASPLWCDRLLEPISNSFWQDSIKPLFASQHLVLTTQYNCRLNLSSGEKIQHFLSYFYLDHLQFDPWNV